MIKYYGVSLTLLSALSLYAAEDARMAKLIRTIPNQGKHFYWNAANEIVPAPKKIKDNAQLERTISDYPNERWFRTDTKTYRHFKKLTTEQDTLLTDGWHVMSAQPNRSRHYLRPDGKQCITVDLEEYGLANPSRPFVEKVAVYDTQQTYRAIKTFETRTANTFDWPVEQSFKFDWAPDSSKFAIVDTLHPWDSQKGCDKIGPETITIYDPNGNFSEIMKLTVPEGAVDEIAFSPQSNFLAAYCNNIRNRKKTVLIWNAVTGYLAAEFADRHYGLRTPVDAQQKAVLEHTWGPDGKSIALFNKENDIEIYQLPQD